jgi:Cu-Zn family superoxide dismutase
MTRIGIGIVIGLMLAGCAGLQLGSPQATAELRNAKGEVVGQARFWEDGQGVRILAEVQGISPGAHGIHLHAVGKCDPPDFATAGAHFNPAGKKHGLKNPSGPHNGDLPNIQVASDGTGRLEYVDTQVTLGAGATSLFGADGTAVVLHARPDDDVTEPSGDSGARIACGVIRKGAGASPKPTGGSQGSGGM